MPLSMEGTIEKVVLTDSFSWTMPDPRRPGKFVNGRGVKGQTIHVKPEWLTETQMGALADPADAGEVLAEQADAEAAGVVGIKTDVELNAMSVPNLLAYVNQFPDEQDRVLALEQTRTRPRKAVLELETPGGPDDDLEPEPGSLGGF